jgi:hypothetical protein
MKNKIALGLILLLLSASATRAQVQQGPRFFGLPSSRVRFARLKEPTRLGRPRSASPSARLTIRTRPSPLPSRSTINYFSAGTTRRR